MEAVLTQKEPNNYSLENFLIQMDELKERQKEFSRSQEEINRVLDRTVRLNEELKQSMKETDRQMKETDRQMQETDRKMQETDRRMKETDLQMKETDRKMQETGRQIGKLGNRFGDLIEHLVAPNLMRKFNELGFHFTQNCRNIEIVVREDPPASTEVDILLENDECVIAVEVKAKPDIDDVKDHIERMKIVRRAADHKKCTKKYCGAIAGAIMDDSIRNYILKNGFYLIEQSGDTVIITIPEGFIPREW